MNNLKKACLSVVLLTLSVPSFATVSLYDFGINIDGTTSCGLGPCDSDGLADLSGVPGVDDSGFDYLTGLGTIDVEIGSVGSHNVNLFLDHQIFVDDQDLNPFNEDGATSGSPEAGQSWEIDEPGFGAFRPGTGGPDYFGDIFLNLVDSNPVDGSFFDNEIFFDAIDNQFLVPPDDVSMGMGWVFDVAADQLATVSFLLSEMAPTSGFFLSHHDEESSDVIYFSSTLTIEDTGVTPVPEPGTTILLGLGLLTLGWHRRRLLAA